MEAAPHAWPALGVLLIRDELLTSEELEAILAEQKDTRQQRLSGRRLGEILVEREIVTQAQVARLVAEQYELPFVELEESDINLQVAFQLAGDAARRFAALPMSALPDGSILLAIADPSTVVFSDELRRALGAPLRFAVVGGDALESAITFVDRHRPVQVEDFEAGQTTDVVVGPRPTETLHDPPTQESTGRSFGSVRAVAHLWPPLGALLLRNGLVTDAQLEAALAQQRLTASSRLGEILVERGVVTTTDVARLVAEQYELPFVELSESDVVVEAALLLPGEIARRCTALPFGFEQDGSLRVAVADPTNVLHSDEVRSALNRPVEFAVAAPGAIARAIAFVYRQEGTVDDMPGTPAVELDETIRRAVELGATTVHFSLQPNGLLVRARIDGVMRELETVEASNRDSVMGRLNTMSRLDTGRGTVDLRVDTMPTTQGEKVTLRVRREATAPVSLTDLELAPAVEEAVRRALGEPFGVFLVCGPAGSGRTRTLHAALQELNTPEHSLATIEDPSEYHAPGIEQVEVDAQKGVTFASGLAAIVRSDAEVILVGELPDEETVQLAFRTATAGRVILSALHAQTTPDAIARLTDMDVEPGLLSSTLSCVVAQRLVRRICPNCRETYYATSDDVVTLGRPAEEAGRRLLGRGRGCTSCGGTGYRGRVGLFEVLVPTDELRELVADRASSSEIRRAAEAAVIQTLRDDGLRRCLEGVTTSAEVRRVVGPANS